MSTLPKFQYSKKLATAKVLVRVDMNVPIKNGVILDDTRIRASLPTIQKLIDKKAKVILLSHLGRPAGRVSKKYSLAPIAAHLSTLLEQSVRLITPLGPASIRKSLASVKPGQVVMMENLRFHKGEIHGEAAFADFLASLGDVFILDGFSVAHRAAPSVVGLAERLPSFAGYVVQDEIAALEPLLSARLDTSLAIIGGAKVETKLPVIKSLLDQVGTILVGGAIVNTYLKAKGYTVGASIVNSVYEFDAIKIMKKRHVIIPIDVIVGNQDGSHYRVVDILKNDRLLALPDEMILDIGPKTIQLFARHIKEAKQILWNGAMGYFEQSPYHIGTMAIARLVATRSTGSAYGIIGGGETIQSMEQVHMSDMVDHISTGGGALLEYIATGTLPGIDALVKKNKKE